MASAASSSKIKNCLTIEEKLNIISELNAEGEHNFAKTAQKHGVSRSVVSRLYKNKDDFIKRHDGLQTSTRKRKKAFQEEDVDSALMLWLQHKNDQNARINAPLLKSKAEQLAKEMGHSFIPTDHWIRGFKDRHGLKFKREHGEKQSTDTESAEAWKTTVLPTLLREYAPEDIYNADETGMYYKGLPDRGYVYKNVTLSGGKKQKERLTVLCCANMTGTDKKELLVIGKSKAPRGFPKDISKLPVKYYNSTNAWMTSAIFLDFLRAWDKNLRLQGRSILLLLDNCSAHPPVSGLTSIRVEFLPPNTTAAIQPMDQGIIRNFKCHYRTLLNAMIISELDADESSTAGAILNKIKVLRAIYFMFDAWNKVTATTISNCYRKAGFALEKDPALMEVDGEETFPVPNNLSTEEFQEFVSIDNDVPVTGELTDTQIVETVVGERMEEPQDDDKEPQQMPSQKELMCSINTIRVFMDMNGLTSQTPFGLVVNDIQQHVISTKRQTSIRDFFKHK